MNPKRQHSIQTPDERRAAADLLRHQMRGQASQGQNFDHAENSPSDGKVADESIEAASKKQYHEAWQNYYQKYYERYYLAQLENQRRRVSTAETNTDRTQRLRSELLTKIGQNARQATKSRHFKPILVGIIVAALILFIQYNQVVSAGVHSLIAPGSSDDSGIIIADAGQPVSQTPTIIIPKLSVKAPIVFNLPSLDENVAQANLENGVIHYPVVGASSSPGENGNTVILGHSSGDIFGNGSFKFIFVQLNRLVAGDLFYIDYSGVRYAYEVERQEIIAPNDLGRLDLGDTRPYATLITCDPIGTNINRLLVIGRQISPDPAAAKSGSQAGADAVQTITGNQPTLFEKVFN